MVDVSDKAETSRAAAAEGLLICAPATLKAVREGVAPKGEVVSTAEIAGVMAAKRTAELIPLCHPLPLSKVAVTIEADEALPGFRVRAEAKTTARTGVEMEALTAASVACLTLYDMLKAIDRTMRITNVRVLSKSGGRSGDWAATPS
jgi:cyclic pyranopterin phosphate synthase